MKYLLTPASQRAVDFASGWILHADCSECSELTAPALLLGLLSESECRASVMLARCGIGASTVQQRWPSLGPVSASDRPGAVPIPFSDEVQLSLRLVQQRLINLPQPLELATEHILLGLAISGLEAAAWLREQGIDPTALDAEIQSLYAQAGHLFAPHGGGRAVEIAGAKENAARHQVGAPTQTAERGILWGEQPPRAAQSTEVAVLRVLDAATNRAQEGLRVVEDYVRFVLDDRHLTGLCKQMRHDLTAALARLPGRQRMAARETQQDVGTELSTASEVSREDAANVLTANFARLQEAIRSLEEFGKLVDANVAAACKQLRYRVYTLQRAVEITRHNIERLAGAQLYVLIDGCPSVAEFQRLAISLIEAKVDVMQLRDKRLGDRELLGRARLLRTWTAESDTLLIVNDRPDVAALARADGVHVGQEELSVKDARTVVGPDALVGVSTHSIEQARQAVLDGADYLGVGPTFPSGTKAFERFPGVDLIRAVAAEIRLPSFAIGGIDRGNLDLVLAAGATRIAVSGAITAAQDPTAAAHELRAAITANP